MMHTITICAGEHRTFQVPPNMHEIEYYIEQDARCTIIDYDNECADYVQRAITFYCAENTALTYYVSLSRVQQHATKQIRVVLQRRHARATIRGLYVLNDSQQITVQTRQEHHAPDTHSDLLIKGVLSDSAQAIYEGTIFIDRTADRSNAQQHNKNLLMSPHAQAKSIPALEVLTNNVSCKHGSAVGQLDPLQLLYVQSRGVDIERAQTLLVAGFIADVLVDY